MSEKKPRLCGVIPETRSELGLHTHCKGLLYANPTAHVNPHNRIAFLLSFSTVIHIIGIYATYDKTALHPTHPFKKTMDCTHCPFSYRHGISRNQRTDKSSSCLPLSNFMTLVKRLNQVFITLMMVIFYCVFIGLAWCISILTKKNQSKQDSYWQAVPKHLPKQYFSSPY